MASETLQEYPSQQLAIGSNGVHELSSPNGRNKQDRQTPRSMIFGQDEGEGRTVNRPSLFGEADDLPARSNSFLFGEEEEEDTNSEAVTSPSVTSPPYWMLSHGRPGEERPGRPGTGGGSRHGRAVSNASVDSVLPRDAITLQDNELEDDDERPGSGDVYGRDRNRACWAKSVKIVDSVLVNGSATNIGAFVVWNIRVETLNGSYMNIRKRYSEFDDLRQRLVQTFPNFEAAVPALPPKSVISKFRPKFLEKRRAGLQYFLNCILLNPEFSGSPVLKEFLFA
ncbi:Phox homologous domain containing protein [Rhypophila decipiens]